MTLTEQQQKKQFHVRSTDRHVCTAERLYPCPAWLQRGPRPLTGGGGGPPGQTNQTAAHKLRGEKLSSFTKNGPSAVSVPLTSTYLSCAHQPDPSNSGTSHQKYIIRKTCAFTWLTPPQPHFFIILFVLWAIESIKSEKKNNNKKRRCTVDARTRWLSLEPDCVEGWSKGVRRRHSRPTARPETDGRIAGSRRDGLVQRSAVNPQAKNTQPETTFHTQRPTSTVERRGPWQETVLHCLSNNNHFKKTKKLSYGRLSAMCFVFILTENKWYIFFKKEAKRHTETVCREAKGAKVQTKNTKTSRFGESDERTRALICKFPITPAAPTLRSDRANANEVHIQPNRSTLNEPERNAV